MSIKNFIFNQKKIIKETLENNQNIQKKIEMTKEESLNIEVTPFNLTDHFFLYRKQIIKNMSVQINDDLIHKINQQINPNEYIINIYSCKSLKDNTYYYLLLTDKMIWIISANGYKILSYDNITFNIIKSSFMSSICLVDKYLLEINSSQEQIITLEKTILGLEPRTVINSKYYPQDMHNAIKYINDFGYGIIFDTENILIYSDVCSLKKITDLIYVQVLLDGSVIVDKKAGNNNFVSLAKDARKMSVKFIFKSEEIILDILKPNSLNSIYAKESNIYIENMDFIKNMISKLGEVSKKWQ